MEERVLELHRSKWRRSSAGDVSQFSRVQDNASIFQCIDEGHLILENVLSQLNINHETELTVWNNTQFFGHLSNHGTTDEVEPPCRILNKGFPSRSVLDTPPPGKAQ